MSTLKEKALIGQAGGTTAVSNQSLVGVIEEVKRHKQITDLYGSIFGISGMLKKHFIDLLSLKKTTLKELLSTPAHALGSSRYKLNKEEIELVILNLKEEDINYLFLIGGNDTASNLLSIARRAKQLNYALRTVLIPKTIDNDLWGTDHSPGYGSVARFIAQITQEVGKDTEAMREVDPIKIIEVMGRNSGWIVAASGLGKKTETDAPHLMYFPERPFQEKKFLSDVKRLYQKLGYAVIVISETIRDQKGRRLGQLKKVHREDPFGHSYVEGAAQHLSLLIEEKLGLRSRFDKPGTIQRLSMSYISELDQREAYQLGREAVKKALQNKTEIMLTLCRKKDTTYGCRIGTVPLSKVAGKEKHLSPRFINRAGNFITKDFLAYAQPLIAEPLPRLASVLNKI